MFLATCFKYCSLGLPTAFFLDIAPSRMFTTISLCLIICLIHEWVYFFKFLKVIFLLSPFEKLHHLLFYLSFYFWHSPAPCFPLVLVRHKCSFVYTCLFTFWYYRMQRTKNLNRIYKLKKLKLCLIIKSDYSVRFL